MSFCDSFEEFFNKICYINYYKKDRCNMEKWKRFGKEIKFRITGYPKSSYLLDKPRKSIDILYDRLDTLMEDKRLVRSNS